MKGILVRGAGIVRNLNSRLALHGIVIDIKIRAFIETVVKRSRGGCSKVIVDVRIAMGIRTNCLGGWLVQGSGLTLSACALHQAMEAWCRSAMRRCDREAQEKGQQQ